MTGGIWVSEVSSNMFFSKIIKLDRDPKTSGLTVYIFARWWLRDMETYGNSITHITNLSDGKPKWQEFHHLTFLRVLGMGLRVRSRGTSMIVLCWRRRGQFDLESEFVNAGTVNELQYPDKPNNHKFVKIESWSDFLDCWTRCAGRFSKECKSCLESPCFWNSEMKVGSGCSNSWIRSSIFDQGICPVLCQQLLGDIHNTQVGGIEQTSRSFNLWHQHRV